MKKTKGGYRTWFARIRKCFGKMGTVIVSGIPGKKFYLRPSGKYYYGERNLVVKKSHGIPQHEKRFKPTPEKQTLIRERKKVSMRHH